MIHPTDLNRITAITKDLESLQVFIDSLNSIKNDRIKALYLVTDKSFQVELKGNFSREASLKLLSLVIDSREALKEKLNKVLEQVYELSKKD